jgi:YidC/Oxa1 family membrane protein insertase
MKKLLNKKVALIIGLLFVLTACTNVIDPATKQVYPDKIIYLTTTFSSVFSDESWFTALLIYPLSQAINWLDQYVGVVLSISIVTIAIKLLTLGATIKSTVASQKMQMINPELKRIQAKYEGKTDNQSKMKMGQEMQALYSKHNINPFGAMGVMFIQFPVIIAMYQAVQRADAVASGVVLGSSLSLSPWQAFGQGVWLFMAIYLLMGVFQFVSMRLPIWLQKKNSPVKEKKYADEKKSGPNMEIMMYSSIGFIMFLAIGWPTAMSLYWLVTSLAQVGQTLFIQHRYIDPEQGL